jgi:mRNA-degrading endonuclease toxin of MazEF toxin-antitoxin module
MKRFDVVRLAPDGLHVVVGSNDDRVIVVPLESATDAEGRETYPKWEKSWARVLYGGKYCAALCEQIHSVEQARVKKAVGHLGEFDQMQLESKLRFVLGLWN